MSNLPKGWEEVKLGEILNIQTGKKNAQDSKENGEYPFFTRSIDTQKIDTYSFDTEALFIAGEGNFTVKYYKGKFDLHQRTYMLTALKENTVDLKFLQNNIQPKVYQLVATSVGSTVQSLRKPIIEALKIPLPPLEEQKKIADILSTVDKKIAFVEENINATEELKKGLMQKLLTEGIGHTEFKDSELGRIPESWEVTKLNEMIDNNSITSHLDGNHGGLYPKQSEFVESGVPYISANMIQDSKINFSTSKYLTEERASLFRKGVARNNDVLFAHNATVGPVALLKTDLEYVILSTTLTYYRCDSSKLSNLYILYYMQSPKFINQYEKTMKQSTRNQIPITQQRNLYFILPPLEEQKQIAEILSTVDKKIENLKEKKQSFEELKKGLMQKLLTGEVRV